MDNFVQSRAARTLPAFSGPASVRRNRLTEDACERQSPAESEIRKSRHSCPFGCKRRENDPEGPWEGGSGVTPPPEERGRLRCENQRLPSRLSLRELRHQERRDAKQIEMVCHLVISAIPPTGLQLTHPIEKFTNLFKRIVSASRVRLPLQFFDFT
jgi:hypothetical protein